MEAILKQGMILVLGRKSLDKHNFYQYRMLPFEGPWSARKPSSTPEAQTAQ
jgi:hypothetical protein